MTLSEIEHELRISFPKRWHEIYNTGAMEWLEAGSEVFAANREKYINNPKSFLILDCADCEPIMFHEIPGWIEELDEWLSICAEEEGWTLKHGLRLIPFAMNGGGDLFCFLYGDSREPRVIMFFHDCFEEEYPMWEDIDEFLYSRMLLAAENGEDTQSAHWNENLKYLNEDYRKKLLANHLEELKDKTIKIFE